MFTPAGQHAAPRSTVKLVLRIVVFVVLALALYGLALWVLWRPVLEPLWNGSSLQMTIKNWYLGDQLSYMAIAGNVQHGRSAYVEPLTYTGTSIYPSGYYWLLGLFARATGTNALFAWNVLGLASTLLVALGCGAWGKWATRSTWGWLMGPLPLLVGTLVWYHDDHAWKVMYGHQAMLWPAFAVLFNPAAEVTGLGIGLFALLTAVRAMAGERMSWRWMAGSGALVGLALNTHTYTALFAIMAIGAALLLRYLFVAASVRHIVISVAAVLVAWVLVLVPVSDNGLIMLGLLVVGMVAPLVIVSPWRTLTWRALLGFAVAAAVVSLPIFLRDVADVLSADSFLKWRDSVGNNDSVSLPFVQTVAYTLPTILVAGAALVSALRKSDDTHFVAWAAGIAGAAVAALVLTFNASWGMNQEPYRFYPYAALFLAATGLPWLFSSLRLRLTLLPRIVVAASLLATAPTTLQFAKDTSKTTLNISHNESVAYNTVAAASPKGLLLTDLCIPRKGFRVLTSKTTLDMNAGLARPKNYNEIKKVMDEQQVDGVLPSGADLQAAGVTSFLTMNYCKAIDSSVLEARFGAPVATVTPLNADACGMPRDTTYTLYSTAADHGATTTPIPAFDKEHPRDFRKVVSGPAPEPGANCAYALDY